MANRVIYVLVLLFVFFSCKENNDTKNPSLEEEISSKIDSLANRYLQLNRFSGTILIFKENEIVYNQSFGLADYQNKVPFNHKTAFKIGEITKLVTENILKGLVKENKIKPTDSLSKYLENIKSNITVNDLMNKKSEVDYNIVGKLIEKASNKSYQENIEAYCTELGLENTYFDKIDSLAARGYLYYNYRGKGLELQKSPTYNLEEAFSSKGLKSTAIDLMKILDHNQEELSLDGYLDNDGFSYSLDNDKEKNVSIIILSNRRHPVAKEMSNSIKAILENTEYTLPLLREPFDIDKTTLKDFVGHYSLNEHVNFEVKESNDSLFVFMGPNKTHLIPQSSNQFYMEEMDASMKFLQDSTNLVNKVLLLNGFIDSEQIANRIKNK